MKLQTKSIILHANILITAYDQMSAKVSLAIPMLWAGIELKFRKEFSKIFLEYVAMVTTEGSLIQNMSSSSCAKKSA